MLVLGACISCVEHNNNSNNNINILDPKHRPTNLEKTKILMFENSPFLFHNRKTIY